MKNLDVQALITGCLDEIIHIETLINAIGSTNHMVPYLNKYAIIKSCGTIEVSFKTIIVDHCSRRSKKQVKNFLNKNVRESSTNPSYEKILKTLKSFDDQWSSSLKAQLQTRPDYSTILTSLQSLVDARNEFAHGGNPNISIGYIKQYFTDAAEIIAAIDQIVR